jgi:hypothetical protein
MMTPNAPLSSLLVILLSFFGIADGQLGDLCSCSPTSYTFTFNFGLTCPPVNVTRNGGIKATYCQISQFGNATSSITDLVPVEVGFVDIVELGQAFNVLSQENITGTFFDGDSFSYTSIVALNDTLEELPKVLQLNIFGFNADGEPIVNFYALAFTNICTVYPILFEGDSAGWTEFVSIATNETVTQ